MRGSQPTHTAFLRTKTESEPNSLVEHGEEFDYQWSRGRELGGGGSPGIIVGLVTFVAKRFLSLSTTNIILSSRE